MLSDLFDQRRGWFVLYTVAFSQCMVIVQAVSANVVGQLYMSVMLLLLISVMQFQVKPYKFAVNNFVDLVCKIGQLILMICSTSFVDDSLRDSEHDRADQESLGFIMIAVFALVLLVSGYWFLRC